MVAVKMLTISKLQDILSLNLCTYLHMQHHSRDPTKGVGWQCLGTRLSAWSRYGL